VTKNSFLVNEKPVRNIACLHLSRRSTRWLVLSLQRRAHYVTIILEREREFQHWLCLHVQVTGFLSFSFSEVLSTGFFPPELNFTAVPQNLTSLAKRQRNSDSGYKGTASRLLPAWSCNCRDRPQFLIRRELPDCWRQWMWFCCDVTWCLITRSRQVLSYRNPFNPPVCLSVSPFSQYPSVGQAASRRAACKRSVCVNVMRCDLSPPHFVSLLPVETFSSFKRHKVESRRLQSSVETQDITSCWAQLVTTRRDRQQSKYCRSLRRSLSKWLLRHELQCSVVNHTAVASSVHLTCPSFQRHESCPTNWWSINEQETQSARAD
jgi:hypothetical protein